MVRVQFEQRQRLLVGAGHVRVALQKARSDADVALGEDDAVGHERALEAARSAQRAFDRAGFLTGFPAEPRVARAGRLGAADTASAAASAAMSACKRST